MADQRGHTVHFVGLEQPFRFKDNFSDNILFHQVSVHDYPVFDYPPYTLALASQLVELIEACDIDVIHSHYALPHAVAAHLAREMTSRKVKTVTTLHGTDITVVGSHPGMKNITRHAIMTSDAVTAVSDNLRETAEKTLDIPPGKIQTIYNFVNPHFFNPDLAGSIRIDKKDRLAVCHVSNLRAVKSPLDVVGIFHGISRAVDRPVELWIIGEGPMQCSMLSLAAELGIRDRVRFFGIRHVLGPLLANADLFLLPSRQESFGLAALEAMACGVPVVASRVGGLPEVIEDGVSGMLFDVGDIGQAVDKAAQLLTDAAFRERVRQAGLETATRRFCQDQIIAQYERLYLSP
jgi:N-acetyl-alpha-D-glucosaminyl L-malate synthase BshA